MELIIARFEFLLYFFKKFGVIINNLFTREFDVLQALNVQHNHLKPIYHKKRSFPLRISSVNATAGLVTFTEEILNGKLHFLCSVQ